MAIVAVPEPGNNDFQTFAVAVSNQPGFLFVDEFDGHPYSSVPCDGSQINDLVYATNGYLFAIVETGEQSGIVQITRKIEAEQSDNASQRADVSEAATEAEKDDNELASIPSLPANLQMRLKLKRARCIAFDQKQRLLVCQSGEDGKNGQLLRVSGLVPKPVSAQSDTSDSQAPTSEAPAGTPNIEATDQDKSPPVENATLPDEDKD